MDTRKRIIIEIIIVGIIGIIIAFVSAMTIYTSIDNAVRYYSAIPIISVESSPSTSSVSNNDGSDRQSLVSRPNTDIDNNSDKDNSVHECPPCEDNGTYDGYSGPCYPYYVQYGDTLSDLSYQWGKSVDEIAHRNHIDNKDLIYYGSTLCRPVIE